MKLLKPVFALFSLCLASCTISPSDTLSPERHSLVLREGGHLNVSELWPVEAEGAYLQQLTMTLKEGTQYTFSVHITLSPHSLEAVAFHDIHGRLYHLTLTPQGLETEVSSFAEDKLKPEDIMVDFLLSHLPPEKLQTLTKDLHIYREATGMLTLMKENTPLRTIARSGPLAPWMWKTIHLENPIHGYSLQVTTVRQP